MKESPAKHVKSPSSVREKKTFQIKLRPSKFSLARRHATPHKNHYDHNILANLDYNGREVKHFVAHQMQNFLWKGDVQPLKIIIY